jgi:hypothetical protein
MIRNCRMFTERYRVMSELGTCDLQLVRVAICGLETWKCCIMEMEAEGLFSRVGNRLQNEHGVAFQKTAIVMLAWEPEITILDICAEMVLGLKPDNVSSRSS